MGFDRGIVHQHLGAAALFARLTDRGASLLDGDGNKVVDSRDAGRRFKPSGKDEYLELEPFDLPEVLSLVREKREGVRATNRDGRAELAAVARLDVLGWYYVVEVDADTLGRR